MMRLASPVALLILSLSAGIHAIRTPVQLEALRREVIDTHGAKLAAGAPAEEVSGTSNAHALTLAKRESTISFANPAAAGSLSH